MVCQSPAHNIYTIHCARVQLRTPSIVCVHHHACAHSIHILVYVYTCRTATIAIASREKTVRKRLKRGKSGTKRGDIGKTVNQRQSSADTETEE